MSVCDNERKVFISDCLTGKVICTLPYDDISLSTLYDVVQDILNERIDNGIMVKVGY